MIEGGRIIAAAQEERFSRVKHDARFPAAAVCACLKIAGLRAEDIDLVAFYEKPFLKFERLLETYLAFAPRGFASFRRAMPLWLKEKLFQKRLIAEELNRLGPGLSRKAWEERLLFAEHHISHAASAFFPSPFDRAVVLTLDGVGEWATTTAGHGEDNRLIIERELHFPHSLGLLYSAFTYYLGFKVNSGEYKVMGLAPYGTPRFAQTILDHLIDLKPDGTFRLALDHFDYATGLTMTNERFHRLFGSPPRAPETRLTQREMDLAASIQAVTEEVVLRLARSVRPAQGARNLCLAGGVALNCVANGKVWRTGEWDGIWIQPAAGDAGGAIGAALAAWHLYLGRPRAFSPGRDAMAGALLGPAYTDEEIASRLAAAGARFDRLSEAELIARTVDALEAGRVVGWFQGRMEFGPRALGARSILGDPRRADMQKTMNLRIKFRESFRPFAPAVLREHVAEWFELDTDSPYMLLVAPVAAHRRRVMTEEEQALFGIDKLNVVRSEIPAVTHVDHSARIQTVDEETNPGFARLLRAWYERTGCPVLVNTSFNVRGEPIVCTPEDAFACFMGTGIEHLAIGSCWLSKPEQDERLAHDRAAAFAPD